MPTLTDPVEDLVARWRDDADADNPAGPLFTRRYAEAELVAPSIFAWTGCSVCTPSRTAHCC